MGDAAACEPVPLSKTGDAAASEPVPLSKRDSAPILLTLECVAVFSQEEPLCPSHPARSISFRTAATTHFCASGFWFAAAHRAAVAGRDEQADRRQGAGVRSGVLSVPGNARSGGAPIPPTRLSPSTTTSCVCQRLQPEAQAERLSAACPQPDADAAACSASSNHSLDAGAWKCCHCRRGGPWADETARLATAVYQHLQIFETAAP